jgi:hypothetical protein
VETYLYYIGIVWQLTSIKRAFANGEFYGAMMLLLSAPSFCINI